jgi:hypothetical protein
VAAIKISQDELRTEVHDHIDTDARSFQEIKRSLDNIDQAHLDQIPTAKEKP